MIEVEQIDGYLSITVLCYLASAYGGFKENKRCGKIEQFSIQFACSVCHHLNLNV